MKKIIIIMSLVIALALGGIWFYRNNQNINIKPIISQPSPNINEIFNTKEISERKNIETNLLVNENNFPLELPEGFEISLFAENLIKPRVLVEDAAGNIIVSDINQGKVILLPDTDNNGKADEEKVLLENLNRPHGMAFYCENNNCYLYVAEETIVKRYEYDENNFVLGKSEILFDLPKGERHFTRYLEIVSLKGEETLLISIGSNCNVCYEKDERLAAVYQSNLDGSDFRPFAIGLRNAVYMTTHHNTGEVWVTEMGRDWLGDDFPPDEINILRENGHYGYPICLGENIHDTDFDKNQYLVDPCLDMIPSYIDIPAHSAPLGLDFIAGPAWPEDFQDDLIVAMHGSWNRSEPAGYKVIRYELGPNGEYIDQHDFITGWLKEDDQALGRVAGILIQSNGKMYLTDDKAGVIYLVRFAK